MTWITVVETTLGKMPLDKMTAVAKFTVDRMIVDGMNIHYGDR
jgi:hypothetical protein